MFQFNQLCVKITWLFMQSIKNVQFVIKQCSLCSMKIWLHHEEILKQARRQNSKWVEVNEKNGCLWCDDLWEALRYLFMFDCFSSEWKVIIQYWICHKSWIYIFKSSFSFVSSFYKFPYAISKKFHLISNLNFLLGTFI